MRKVLYLYLRFDSSIEKSRLKVAIDAFRANEAKQPDYEFSDLRCVGGKVEGSIEARNDYGTVLSMVTEWLAMHGEAKESYEFATVNTWVPAAPYAAWPDSNSDGAHAQVVYVLEQESSASEPLTAESASAREALTRELHLYGLRSLGSIKTLVDSIEEDGDLDGLKAARLQIMQAGGEIALSFVDAAIGRISAGERKDAQQTQRDCTFLRDLSDNREGVRLEALQGLIEGRSDQINEALIRSLGDAAPAIRLLAAREMDLRGQPEWREWVQGDKKDLIRVAQGGSDFFQGPLIAALSHWQWMSEAAELLGNFGDQSAVRPLCYSLHRNPASRDFIAPGCISLGKLGDPWAIPTLRYHLTDYWEKCRNAAEKALAAFGGNSGVTHQ